MPRRQNWFMTVSYTHLDVYKRQPHTPPKQSWTFSNDVNAEIRRAAATGIYDIRGGGSKRRLPHFDDLLFLGASISRYPLEGYREKCATDVWPVSYTHLNQPSCAKIFPDRQGLRRFTQLRSEMKKGSPKAALSRKFKADQAGRTKYQFDQSTTAAPATSAR